GGRVLDPLAVATGGGADLVESGKFVKVDQGRLVAARRLALRIHSQSGAADRTPHRIVHDHEQDGQFVDSRGMVKGDRVAKDVRAVAQDGDHEAVGGRELGAECRPAAPAETGSGARTKIAPRAGRAAM